MRNINIFCFGFGQVAKNFINKIRTENFKINLSITSTSKTCTKYINGFYFESYFFNNESYDENLVKKLKEADYILVSIPPNEGEDIVIKNFSRFKKFKCKMDNLSFSYKCLWGS